MDLERVAGYINQLGNFLGKRDIPVLTSEALQQAYQIQQADALILFGGSIPKGAEVAAEAMQAGVAKCFIISGGEGHTTASLREKIKQACPHIETQNKGEADLLSEYIQHQHHVMPDYLERASTNCGNNVTYTIQLLREQGISMNHIIIIQDATMQRRMEAGFRKYVGDSVTIINYAAYAAKVIVKDGMLAYEENIWGMWDIERYLTLLMGEIPRLTNNQEGYGPKGKNFIAAVEIPEEVQEAFEYLKKDYSNLIRVANPLYQST
ncbi:MAG: YdcF family protein, partial [Cellulosilyticaceae bacterium]